MNSEAKMEHIDLVIGLLQLEGLPFKVEKDLRTLMHATRGRMNPGNAAGVWVFPDNPDMRALLTSIYQAVDFIREQGFQKLCPGPGTMPLVPK